MIDSLSNLTLFIEMSRPQVFFDIAIGGQPAGRIVFQVVFVFLCKV